MKQTTSSLGNLIRRIWAADNVADTDRLTFETIALAAESGELLNQFKKHRFYRNQDRTDEIIDELCDAYYHVNALCQVLGISRAELEQRTIEKHSRNLEKLLQEQRNLTKKGSATANRSEKA